MPKFCNRSFYVVGKTFACACLRFSCCLFLAFRGWSCNNRANTYSAGGNMRRYLGSKMTAFAAVICPLFIVAPVCFAAAALCSGISAATVFVAIACAICTGIWFLYMCQNALQLYTWGTFDDAAVRVKGFLIKQAVLDYDKCRSVGIGCYTHGILNSNVGEKVFFIFLSHEMFEEKYRTNINHWKPSLMRIKVGFDSELYEYLLSVLPAKHAGSLRHDWEKYFSKEQTEENR